jgi:hypothetical protein
MRGERYPFIGKNSEATELDVLPLMPIELSLRKQRIQMVGLLDTAALVNVLPFSVGKQLGADWDRQTHMVRLTGNLANHEARGLVLMASVATFPAVRLAFAWAATDQVPLLLGQMNFFQEFDACFYRSQSFFEVRPRQTS